MGNRTNTAHAVANSHGQEHAEGHDASHDEHVLHQLQNKPWGGFICCCFFLFHDCLGRLSLLCCPKGITGRVGSIIVSCDGRNYFIFGARWYNSVYYFVTICNAHESSICLDGIEK